MTETHPDQIFVEYVVKSIVKNPDDVQVNRTIDERGVLLNLSLNSEDMGTIIGKNGQTAKALRVLLRVIGSKNSARVNLRVLDPAKDEESKSEESATSDVIDSIDTSDI